MNPRVLSATLAARSSALRRWGDRFGFESRDVRHPRLSR